MKYIIVFMSIFLTGCMTAPVKHSMPNIPKELSEKCQTLKQVPESEEKLSELLKVINQNYGLYYDCMIKQESLVEWYNKQKKIHDDLHN